MYRWSKIAAKNQPSGTFTPNLNGFQSIYKASRSSTFKLHVQFTELVKP